MSQKTMHSIIGVNKLNSGYVNSHVLFDVNFEAKEKEITIVVGPNGSGKSTLLKSIFGLCTIYSGEISYNGEEITGLAPHEVAVLFLGFAEILQFTQSAAQHEVLDDVRWFGPGANTKEHKLIEDPIGLEFSTNVQFTTVQVAASKNPTYERVQEHLTELLGRTPNTFVHSSYDAVWIIGLSMLETQSSDVSTIKAILPEIAENYSGAIGPTKLNEAGDLAQADYEVWGIRGGDWVLLGKYTQSDDSVNLI